MVKFFPAEYLTTLTSPTLLVLTSQIADKVTEKMGQVIIPRDS